MRRTRSVKVAVVTFFLAAVPAVLAYSAGPPAGHTGAPGELTCRECHNSFPLNDAPGSLALEGVPDVYVPGQAYTITVRIAHPQRRRWGFEVSAYTDALEMAGELAVTDPAHTRKLTEDGKSYIEHVNAGTYAGQANGASWTFRWTAPAASAGLVTFYAAGNASNNNGGTTGDNIYTAFAESHPSQSVPAFTDVTAQSGLDARLGGDGFAWADYDGDGDLDVFVARAGRGLLYRNDGGHFAEAGAQVGLSGATDATAAAWGDADNDGRPDLALATPSGPRLFKNSAAGFAETTAATGLPTGSAARAVAWADYDGDGDLDLLAATAAGARLMRNGGTATFDDATAAAGFASVGVADAIAWADFDRDGRLDVFFATAAKGMLFRQGDAGAFAAVSSGALDGATNGRGVAWADYDGDADLDLFVIGDAALRLLRNDNGSFVDVTSAAGLGGLSGRSIALGDADDDGLLDVFVTGSVGDRLMDFDGRIFAEITNRAGVADVDGRAVAWADYDGDGHADLLELSATSVALWKSPSQEVTVTVRAVTDADGDATDADTAADRDEPGATVAFDADGNFETGLEQARVVDGGGSSAQAPPRAIFAMPAGGAAVRATFANGEGRQAAAAGGVVTLREAKAATITSVVYKNATGTPKLVVNGERFKTSSEIIEVDGFAMDATKYPSKKQLPGGITTRISGTDASFATLVPVGRTVRVTTFDPATGIRSAPFLFTR